MLDKELDLVILFGSLTVVRAKQELIDLIQYIQKYNPSEIEELWLTVKESLSLGEQRWLVNVLQESLHG